MRPKVAPKYDLGKWQDRTLSACAVCNILPTHPRQVYNVPTTELRVGSPAVPLGDQSVLRSRSWIHAQQDRLCDASNAACAGSTLLRRTSTTLFFPREKVEGPVSHSKLARVTSPCDGNRQPHLIHSAWPRQNPQQPLDFPTTGHQAPTRANRANHSWIVWDQISSRFPKQEHHEGQPEQLPGFALTPFVSCHGGCTGLLQCKAEHGSESTAQEM